MARIFSEVRESEITRTIASMFNDTLQEYSQSDVIVIGGGPAGLTAA